MIDRISGARSHTYSDAEFSTGARSANSQNPLLATMSLAKSRLSGLQASADAWLASAQARVDMARDANGFATLAGEMAKRASAGAKQEMLPQALRDFALRHDLISTQAASEPLDAAALQHLASKLQSLALNDGASSTSEQIQLKRFVTSYDNTLTLYNAVISRLGEVTKKIVNSI
ncbi:hypothetical protein PI93_023410 [Pandoraea fibrosis]|uniref:Uncharacterized protein n=1 Tax=Pandoraea fibrosis TaxID=1891094 RepID=A0ABX6HXT0_9BURK|nr:hypothetical protein [Pandoraea fibrosis]QHE94431.1 hypothetical protein PJ20_023405 [Pandoraea fibrosis]QHF15269.1 hypothetical protein PI93_023410 [Pandoraea fibrosis]